MLLKESEWELSQGMWMMCELKIITKKHNIPILCLYILHYEIITDWFLLELKLGLLSFWRSALGVNEDTLLRMWTMLKITFFSLKSPQIGFLKKLELCQTSKILVRRNGRLRVECGIWKSQCDMKLDGLASTYRI